MSKETEAEALIIPLDIEVEGTTVHRKSIVFATDVDTAVRAAAIDADETGADSWSMQEVDREGTPVGSRRFFFSSETWKAPWQPTGPKPIWNTEEPKPQRLN